jgi:hypothetical protein
MEGKMMKGLCQSEFWDKISAGDVVLVDEFLWMVMAKKTTFLHDHEYIVILRSRTTFNDTEAVRERIYKEDADKIISLHFTIKGEVAEAVPKMAQKRLCIKNAGGKA